MGRAWSFSRLTTFERCPKQFEYQLNRVPEAGTPSPALERGSRIHKDAEEYLRGVHAKVPATLQTFATQFQELRKCKARSEQQIAVDVNFLEVAWYSELAWLRIVVDAQLANKAIDFKTGREYPDHLDQLELYGLVLAKLQPKFNEVVGELWYIDQAQILTDVIPTSSVDALEEKWRARAAPLIEAEKFPATPGRHCSWCGWASAKGGPCKKDQSAM